MYIIQIYYGIILTKIAIKCYIDGLTDSNRLFEVVETLGRVHLVTEWIQGGELYNRISQEGPLKETHASKLCKQLLLAVQHMVLTNKINLLINPM